MAQRGVCAVCREPEKYLTPLGVPKRLAVDHSHITGKNRGLLCTDCNFKVGYRENTTSEEYKAIDSYLEKYND